MPENRLASYPGATSLVGADRFPFTERVGYEEGPIHFQDSTKGLLYQTWRIRIVGDTVYVSAPNTPETALFSNRLITQVSLSFDQNARYLVAYLVNYTEMWLYWYDPVIQSFAHVLLETGVRDVHITMPDKRTSLIGISDVGLFYTREDKLCARWQLDRYTVEYVMETGIGGRLLRVGLNAHFRLQFIFQAQPYTTYSCTLNLNCL